MLIIAVLLEKGMDVNKKTRDGRNTLMIAVQYGKACAVAFLMSSNEGRYKRWSLITFFTLVKKSLFRLVKHAGDVLIIAVLLEKGMDVNNKTRDGRNALMTAVQYRKEGAVMESD